MPSIAVTRAILVVSCLSSLPSAVFGQNAPQAGGLLPAGPGRELVAARCASCHDLKTAVSKRAALAEWRETIASMVQRGAVIPEQEVSAIAAYLAEHYGSGGGSSESAAALPDGPGRELFMSKCFQCHNQGFWGDLRQDRRGWEAVLYRMVGRRALWTEEEIKTMADYLARVRGPK